MFEELRDTWPLPIMTDLLEQLGGSKFFSSMDLLKGFHQVKVHEDSINKLTIATPYGNFSYIVMPFGIQNGPSTFCRAIYLALKDLIYTCVVAYIDDIIIHSPSVQQHMEDLEKFLLHIKEANMVLNANKCTLFRTSVNFVGFVVDSAGYAPDPERIKAISNFPTPTCQRDVRASLGVIGFYRRHIHLYTEYTVKLTSLLKKNTPFIWTNEHQMCFEQAKQLLQEDCFLVYPNYTKKFFLFTDASDYGVGAALCHLEGDDYIPIFFASRKLQPAEVRYPTVEKELLAVVFALKRFRKFLLDQQFTLFTDNTAVTYLFEKKDASQRLQRWTLCCMEFQFTVKHIKGTRNCVADALSRYPPGEIEETNGLDDACHLKKWTTFYDYEMDAPMSRISSLYRM